MLIVAVVAKTEFDLRGDELLEEINQRLFAAETKLMTFVLKNYKDLDPVLNLTDLPQAVAAFARRQSSRPGKDDIGTIQSAARS